MSWNLDAFSLIVLFGACQGLILSFILFFSKRESIPGKNCLGFFILVLTYNGFETFNWSAGLSDYTLFFDFFPFVLIFGLGPALYGYVYALTHPQIKLPKRMYWHLLPMFFQFLFRVALFAYHIFWLNNGNFFGLTPSDIDNWHAKVSEPLSVISFCFYLMLSLKLYSNYKKKNNSDMPIISAHEKKQIIQSLALFLSATSILAIMWVLTVFTPSLLAVGNNHYLIIEIFLVMLVYWTAFAGYRKTKVVYVTLQKPAPVSLSSFSIADLEKVAICLKQSMEIKKLYLDPEITVNKLAAHLNISSKVLSSVLNQHLKKGFSEFVNDYRIAEVKEKLLLPINSYLTITGIAFESGFNSQATFGRVFKNATGMSPKEFMSSKNQELA